MDPKKPTKPPKKDSWQDILEAFQEIVHSRHRGLETKINKLEKIIMASNQELLDAVAAGKAAVLAAVEAEKTETLAAIAVLQTKITELEAVIAAGGDTQPAIDAVNAAFAEVKSGVEGITVTPAPAEPGARRK